MSTEKDENVENDDDLVHDEKPEVKTFILLIPNKWLVYTAWAM